MASLVGFIAMNHISAYDDDLVLGLNAYFASDFLLWTTLFFVKASFLALMWSVFEISTTFRKFWWAVSAYTFIAFLVCIICELWTCGSPSDFGNFDICIAAIESTTSMVSSTPDVLKFVFHISSDLLILALPLFEIRKLQMSPAKRFSVAAVFALTIVDIIMGILRNSSSICEDSQATWNSDVCVSMNIIFTILELSFAVIVCALPAYRAILPSSRQRRYESRELRRNAANMGHAVQKRSGPSSHSKLSESSKAGPRIVHDTWPMAEDRPAHSLTVSVDDSVETRV